MSFIVRKVTKAKWNNQLEDDCSLNLIVTADAITNCLKTKSNTLSIWKVDNENDAILALASMNDSIVPIDYIIFEDLFFSTNKVIIEQVMAQANPIEELRDKHYDIVNLDYDSLGIISKEIAKKITSDKINYIKRCTTSTVKKLLLSAINDKKLKLEDLNDNLQNKLKKK